MFLAIVCGEVLIGFVSSCVIEITQELEQWPCQREKTNWKQLDKTFLAVCGTSAQRALSTMSIGGEQIVWIVRESRMERSAIRETPDINPDQCI
jgi:TRAP-type C4-dicarboxylate transport system permease large subunit